MVNRREKRSKKCDQILLGIEPDLAKLEMKVWRSIGTWRSKPFRDLRHFMEYCIREGEGLCEEKEETFLSRIN